MKNKAIINWLKIVSNQNNTIEDFKKVYAENIPTAGELIMAGDCPYSCQHCFYSKDYASNHPSIKADDWKRIINKLHEELKIKTFVHCGRVLNQNGIEILAYLRNNFKDVEFGFINDGKTLTPYLDQLEKIKPDWIDISIDGMEKEHDLQRNSQGRFKQALDTMLVLKKKKISKKINTLTTITNINVKIIPKMLNFFNQKGFTNFFLSPVISFNPWMSKDYLKATDKNILRMFKEVKRNLKNLNNVWIQYACFEAEQLEPFLKNKIVDLDNFKVYDNGIYWDFQSNGNTLRLSFEPFSMVGVKDCVINPSGQIIYNKSMAIDKAPKEFLPGDALHDDLKKMYKNLPYKPVAKEYIKELKKEMELFKRYQL